MKYFLGPLLVGVLRCNTCQFVTNVDVGVSHALVRKCTTPTTYQALLANNFGFAMNIIYCIDH